MKVEQIDINKLSFTLKECESGIVGGKIKLSLTASLLQRLNYALQQLEYNTEVYCDGRNEEPIRFLQELVKQIPKLTITQRIKRETWRVDISRFINLKYLELSRIPIHLVEGLQSLRPQLQVLICERCGDCVEEILGKVDEAWQELKTAKLCYNDIGLLTSFVNTPCLQYLDLSYNKITDKYALNMLTNLKYLNMSFNSLSSVPMLSDDVCRNLQVLILNNNFIQDLSAIGLLENLTHLDVSCNMLAEHSAISPILFLSSLTCINLKYNPISYHPHHRLHTCSFLNKDIPVNQFILDGTLLSPVEQSVVGSREQTCNLLGRPNRAATPCRRTNGASLQDRQVARSLSSKKLSRVREAIIEEGTNKGTAAAKPVEPPKDQDVPQEHLETKKQVEMLRERFGEDHWLHSHAGSFVQDLLGLQKSTGSTVLTSTPYQTEFVSGSPQKSTTLEQKANSNTTEGQENPSTSMNSEFVSAVSEQMVTASSETETSADTGEEDHSNVPSCDETKEKQGKGEGIEEVRQNITEMEESEEQQEEVNEVNNVEDDDDDIESESEDEFLWLVQKEVPGNCNTLTEIFLSLNDNGVREKNISNGRTIAKWSIASILSCVKVRSNPFAVQLTFDTVCKDRQERTYILENADGQALLQKIGGELESRSLSAMNQAAFKCMKCSSIFSQELNSRHKTSLTQNKTSTSCPTCGSTMVIEMDEVPLPSSNKPLTPATQNSALTPPTTTEISSSGTLTNSPSQCSIGSAASLDRNIDSPGVKEIPTPRRYDSDIEVISNPSQSSIEVLEVHGRIQGTGTPSRKRSSEERQLVAVPQLVTVPEVHSSMAGLTESSSSGSLTDSVCTTYESNPTQNKKGSGSGQGVVTDSLPEESTPDPDLQNKITPPNSYASLLEGSLTGSSVNTTYESNPTQNKKGSSVTDSVPEEQTNLSPSPDPDLQKKTTPPLTSYTSLLEGLLQSVSSKMLPKLTTEVDKSVEYSYSDFSQVDHRIKLFLFQCVYRHDDEELVLLLRGHVLHGNVRHSGCVVLSTYGFHILEVTAEEVGDDASDWLQLKSTYTIDQLSEVYALPWHVGVAFQLQNDSTYLILLQDFVRTNNFFTFLLDEKIPKTFKVEPSMSECLPLQQLVLSCSSIEGPVDTNIRQFVVCNSVQIRFPEGSEEEKEIYLAAVLVTSSDVLLIDADFLWMLKESKSSPQCLTSQKVANIVNVEVSDKNVKLHYLNEISGTEEMWMLHLATVAGVNTFIESIQEPWQQLFSVPLQIS